MDISHLESILSLNLRLRRDDLPRGDVLLFPAESQVMKKRILQLAAALVLTGGSLERSPAETVGVIVLPPPGPDPLPIVAFL